MPKLTERIRAAAFDLDGTLIDTTADLAAALNLTLTMLGAPELPAARVKALIGDGIDQLVLRGLTESLGTRPTHAAQRSAALTLFRRLYAQSLFQRSRVFPGTGQGLRALADAGVLLCCITNKDSMFAEPLLEQAGLAGFFAFTLCADRPEDRKPSPNMLLAACARLGIAPAEMLYVGDSTVDIAAARAAGCAVIAVTHGREGECATLVGQPDAYIEKLTDLPATHLRSPTAQPHLRLCTTGAPG